MEYSRYEEDIIDNLNKRIEEHMNITEVTYTLKKNLGQYEHEELTIKVNNDVDQPATGQQMVDAAVRLAKANTHKALTPPTNGIVTADSLPPRQTSAPRTTTGTTAARSTTKASDSRRPYAKKERQPITNEFVFNAKYELDLPQYVPGSNRVPTKECGLYDLLNNHDYRFSTRDKRWYGNIELNLPDKLSWVYDCVTPLNGGAGIPKGEDMEDTNFFDDEDSIPF